jgi:hypothetical protein
MVGCSPRIWKVAASLVCATLLLAGSAARSFAGITETTTLDEWAALSGAGAGSGNVTLLGTIRNSGTHGLLSVAVSGYAVGQYTVSAVTVSTGTAIEVGTLTVRGTRHTGGNAAFGNARSPFPAGLSPFDIATISVSDSNGNVVSTGTLSPVPGGYYNALSPFVPSTSKENGYAMVRAFGACPAGAVTTGSTNSDDATGDETIGGYSGTVDGNYYAAGTGTITGGGSGSLVTNGGSLTYSGVITGTTPGSLVLTPTNGGGLVYIGGIGFVVNAPGANGPSPTPAQSGSTTTTGTLALPPTLTITPLPTPVPIVDDGGDGGELFLADGASEGGLSVGSGFSLGEPVYDIGGGGYVLSLANNTSNSLILVSLSGTIVYGGSGGVIFGSSLTLSSTFAGTINLSDTTSYTGDFMVQTGLPVLLSGPGNLDGATITSGTFSIYTASSTPVDSPSPTPVPTPSENTSSEEASGMHTAALKVKAVVAPLTGEITIHAHGLPANAPVLYVTDTGVSAKVDTDLHGNLTVTAFQGGPTGTLPSTLDLYSIKWIAIEGTDGTVLMTAAF